MVISDAEWNEPLIVLTDVTATATSKPGQAKHSTHGFTGLLMSDDLLCPLRLIPRMVTALKSQSSRVTGLPPRLCKRARLQQVMAQRVTLFLAHYIRWRQRVAGTASTDARYASLPTIEMVEAAAAKADDGEGLRSLLPEESMEDFVAASSTRSFADAVVVGMLDRAANVNPNVEVLEIGGGSSIS